MINPVVTTVSTAKITKSKEVNMLRKQVSEQLGIDAETLRFYEKIQLISDPKRQENGYRIYNENHLQELKFVQHCRSLGIGLKEIKVLKNLLDSKQDDCHEAKEIVDRNLVLIEERIKELKFLKKQLKNLSTSCEELSSPENCEIVKSLKQASMGEACICHH